MRRPNQKAREAVREGVYSDDAAARFDHGGRAWGVFAKRGWGMDWA